MRVVPRRKSAHSAKEMQNKCKAMHLKTKKLLQMELAKLVITSVHRDTCINKAGNGSI